MATVSKSANEADHAAATYMSEPSRSISDPSLKAMPISHTTPRQHLTATNKTAYMVNSSFNHRAVTATATPTPTSPCHRTNDTAPWSSAMANSAVAPTQTPTEAKQPAVAAPSPTLQIPITPASSNGSNSARQISFSASAQSFPKGEKLRSTAQPINRQTYPGTLTTKAHYSRFAGRGNQYKGNTARVTHSNSLTWSRGANPAKESWLRIEKEMRKMLFIPTSSRAKYSPFVPTTFEEFLGHCASVKAEDARKAALQVEQMKLDKERKSRGQPKVQSIFQSRKFTDGMSAVLCSPTIWRNDYGPTAARPQAPWPGDDEMDEEGNQRHGSNTGSLRRFLPLPRVPANDTVVWKQRAMLMPLDFDEVRKLSDCIWWGRKGKKCKKADYETMRRTEEETEIAWADRESNQFWERKMEEALNTGLSVDLAKNKAGTEVMELAKGTAIRKLLQEKENRIRARMRKFFDDSFIDSLNYREENELEEEEKNKNKENKETKTNDTDSEENSEETSEEDSEEDSEDER